MNVVVSLSPPLLAVGLDTIVALAIVGLAVLWLGRRIALAFARRAGSGCACPSASTCSASGPAGTDLTDAARRAVERLTAPPR